MTSQEHAQLLRELADELLASCKTKPIDSPNYKRQSSLMQRARQAAEEIEEREVTGPGLHDKYMIFRRSDETPVHHPCFVLRIDGTDEAAMKALREYANHTACLDLAADLRDHIARVGGVSY